MDILFAMDYPHLHSEFLMDMLGEMLCGINTAMLTTGATKAEHQRSESSLDIATHMGIGQFIHRVEEGEYLSVVLKESDYRFVETGEFLVWLISPGVVRTSAVEYISATIARGVVGYALAIGEAIYGDDKRTLAIIFREGGRTILRMGGIDVLVGHLVSVGAVGCSLLNHCKLRQLCDFLQHLHHIWIWKFVVVEQFAQILYCGWYGVDKMFLMLKISAESVCAQHLQCAEEHEETQSLGEMSHRGHLGVVLQRIIVFIHEFAAQFMRILCRCLPQE